MKMNGRVRFCQMETFLSSEHRQVINTARTILLGKQRHGFAWHCSKQVIKEVVFLIIRVFVIINLK